MSTVGFGDYSPRSNEERTIGSFLLLLGVAIFSYILGVFLELIQNFQALVMSSVDDNNLELFVSVLQKFNKDIPFPEKF